MVLQRLCLSETLHNQRGMALVIALILLCVLTIIGVAATNTSVLEFLISGAEKEKQEAFYAAEAGIEHMRAILKSLFVKRNAARMAAGGTPDWDFALNGSEAGINAAHDTDDPPDQPADGIGDYDGGAVWISNGTIGGNYTYSVRVWNNSDSGSPTNDADGLIYVRSDASGQRGGSKSIEIVLQGGVSGGEAIIGYTAQAGAGPGKAFRATDLEAITDFSAQM